MPHRKHKTGWTNIGLLLGSTLIALIIAEVVFRQARPLERNPLQSCPLLIPFSGPCVGQRAKPEADAASDLFVLMHCGIR